MKDEKKSMLDLMFITNNPDVALAAENSGVNRIWIDLETKGKDLRQKNMDTVKSHHTVADIRHMSKVLKSAELMVRINPWDQDSLQEIEDVIAAGAARIMLPMWKKPEEVDAFLTAVNKRVATTLLLETKEAVECLDVVLDNPLVEEIHIGLNDLHLSYGLTFMFELLSNGTVEKLCNKIAKKGIPYGFGGIARIGEGILPAERILCEHIRLGSKAVILSRAFFDLKKNPNAHNVEAIFREEVGKLRENEKRYSQYGNERLLHMQKETSTIISSIVTQFRKAK